MQCFFADIKLNPVQFGNMQKMDGPTEQCQDSVPTVASNCSHELVRMNFSLKWNIFLFFLCPSPFVECRKNEGQ